MNFNLNHHRGGGGDSPSSSTTSSSDPKTSNSHPHHHNDADPMHSWWESISKARSRIHLLSSLLAPASAASLSALADSDRPARSLLSSLAAYSTVSAILSAPFSGSGDDRFCQWLYDTYLSSDPDLRLVVLSFVPLLSGIYLSRIHSSDSATAPSLAGFEAVLLSLYAAETKARGGKPVLVSIPDLSQPSLYHTPRNKPNPNRSRRAQSIGVLSSPLEHQTAVKSTKRACIVGVALDCYYKQISQMPFWSKLDFCRFLADWAGQDCPCKSEFDNTTEEENIERNGFSDGIRVSEMDEVAEEMGILAIRENSTELVPKGSRIPLPWELLQPVLRILGHCLLGPLNAAEVKDAAFVAVRCLYARASHDLSPQAILATRSLIQLDKRAREAARAAATANAASNTNTPSKAKKPEILLVSK
ncbi:uncharacterized protein LOC127809437 [Diospyros lotus]|uniref:uncharacterized protein LOC127809437 n=1 Tax=Diospyros lotus TaxID=55363 RepID=UPI0022536870|nr:uncharacterized protein LOC127809437 [Diospyros lotus]